MERPCVRVPRERGEDTRRTLADAGMLDNRYQICADADAVFIPIRPERALPAKYDVVERHVERREDQTLPQDILGDAPSYERLGSIALIDEDDPAEARRIADALVESDLPVETVLNSRSKIEGEYRVREWELLAGERTETVHREFGAEFLVDVTRVYFSPRLATERHRVAEQIHHGDRVFDMFAGVGPFAIQCALRGATVVAVDLNPDAIVYLDENIRRNGVDDRVTAIEGDVGEIAATYPDWANRIVMNLPHRADVFLPAARTIAGEHCTLYYYDIQPDEDPYTPGETAIEEVMGCEYAIDVKARRIVRSYAPHEVNVCIEVELNRQ